MKLDPIVWRKEHKNLGAERCHDPRRRYRVPYTGQRVVRILPLGGASVAPVALMGWERDTATGRGTYMAGLPLNRVRGA